LKYGEDVRSRPEYGAIRHEVWSRLRDEVQRAQEQERKNKLDQSVLAARGKQVSLHV
jgi:NitT/TauT family transport system ATP-binding protein